MFAMMILAIHLASRVIVDEPIAPAMGTHFKNLSDVKLEHTHRSENNLQQLESCWWPTRVPLVGGSPAC